MSYAEIHNDGQITVPLEIRRLLKLEDGDKIMFVQKDSGEVIVNKPSDTTNSNWLAFQKAQEVFAGLADEIGYTEEQILEDVMRIRYGENA